MQTATFPTQANGLLAGSILDEYRDFLDFSLAPDDPRQAGGDVTQTCPTECGHDCTGAGAVDHEKKHHGNEHPEKKEERKALSWHDLPRA
jgi:hypothetical protein